MDYAGTRNVCLELLRGENCGAQSAATQLFRFLIYKLCDSGAYFVHTPLLLDSVRFRNSRSTIPTSPFVDSDHPDLIRVGRAQPFVDWSQTSTTDVCAPSPGLSERFNARSRPIRKDRFTSHREFLDSLLDSLGERCYLFSFLNVLGRRANDQLC
jgi:hypothetical protein